MGLRHRGRELTLAEARELYSSYTSRIQALHQLLREGRVRQQSVTQEAYLLWQEPLKKELIIKLKWQRKLKMWISAEAQLINAMKRDDAEVKREARRQQHEEKLQQALADEAVILSRAQRVLHRLIRYQEHGVAEPLWPVLYKFQDYLAVKGISLEQAQDISEKDGWDLEVILPKCGMIPKVG